MAEGSDELPGEEEIAENDSGISEEIQPVTPTSAEGLDDALEMLGNLNMFGNMMFENGLVIASDGHFSATSDTVLASLYEKGTFFEYTGEGAEWDDTEYEYLGDKTKIDQAVQEFFGIAPGEYIGSEGNIIVQREKIM